MEADLKPCYILIPPSPLFAAHWSFFIPNSDSSSHGRRIHVSGDRLNGFKLEIIRAYDVSLHRSVTSGRRFRIGVVPSSSCSVEPVAGTEYVQKDEDEGGGYVDNQAVDELERVCLEVEAPGPSLNRVETGGVLPGRRVKTEVKDCQWWVRQVVNVLCSRGILRADGSEDRDPISIVESLPVH